MQTPSSSHSRQPAKTPVGSPPNAGKRLLPILVAGAVSLGGISPLGADSLWHDSSSRALISDVRARSVGDIITILVQENNSASKDNSTSTSKKTGIDTSISSFLFGAAQDKFLTRGGQYPAFKVNGNSSFDGGGKISNSETITARISVRVVDVLPNGNLVIEGSRHTSFAGESQDAILRGVVRMDDVASNNTVFSYNIADATIRYVSKGSVTDSQGKGWFHKAWDKVSPF